MPAERSPGAPTTPAPAPGEYVLGTNAAEMARLALQQEVWGAVTERFLDRLSIPRGGRVLDLGCGPGLVVPALRARVGPRGRVDALDESPVWRAHLERVAEKQGWREVRVVCARVEDAPLEDGTYDLIFARWVLSFLPGVGDLVRRLARALKPGGALAVQDYNHEGVSLFPESEGFRAVVRATRALYASRGGDIWVAGRLPGCFRAAGLVPLDLVSTVFAGGPSSGPFRWADAFFPAHSEHMVEAGVLGAAERERFLAEWAARRADPDAVFFSPIVVDAAARRPA